MNLSHSRNAVGQSKFRSVARVNVLRWPIVHAHVAQWWRFADRSEDYRQPLGMVAGHDSAANPIDSTELKSLARC
jgi:hypothetical protein